jgi:hypothetical protein
MPVKLISNVSLVSNAAVITTSTDHGLNPGDYVTINGVNSTFDGSFIVLGIESSSVFTYSKIASDVASQQSSGSVIYAQFSNPKPAYMYDKTTDSWFPISGPVDTAKNYIWSGTQLFETNVNILGPTSTNDLSVNGTASVSGSVSFNGPMKLNGGINVYTSASARNAAIPNPTTGTLAYLSSTKKLEVWDGDEWDIVVTANQ